MSDIVKYLFARDANYGTFPWVLDLEKRGLVDRQKLYEWKKKLLPRTYNMDSDPAELYYRRIYLNYIHTYLEGKKEILDIGCQFGRFAIDLANNGHQVTGTDIEPSFEGYIRKRLKTQDSFQYYTEELAKTLKRPWDNKFDVILCMEVSALVPDFSDLLSNLLDFLKPGGIFICTYRTQSYYIKRFLDEGKPEMALKVLQKKYQKFNYYNRDEIAELYKNTGLQLQLIKGIGILSGSQKDPNTSLCNPAKLNAEEQDWLFQLETSETSQGQLLDHGKYYLTVGTKI